jgi:hypothetical protein
VHLGTRCSDKERWVSICVPPVGPPVLATLPQSQDCPEVVRRQAGGDKELLQGMKWMTSSQAILTCPIRFLCVT